MHLPCPGSGKGHHLKTAGQIQEHGHELRYPDLLSAPVFQHASSCKCGIIEAVYQDKLEPIPVLESHLQSVTFPVRTGQSSRKRYLSFKDPVGTVSEKGCSRIRIHGTRPVVSRPGSAPLKRHEMIAYAIQHIRSPPSELRLESHGFCVFYGHRSSEMDMAEYSVHVCSHYI